MTDDKPLHTLLREYSATIEQRLYRIRRALMKAKQDKNATETRRLEGLELAAANTVIVLTGLATQLEERT